jgi:hypothetical protein
VTLAIVGLHASLLTAALLDDLTDTQPRCVSQSSLKRLKEAR